MVDKARFVAEVVAVENPPVIKVEEEGYKIVVVDDTSSLGFSVGDKLFGLV